MKVSTLFIIGAIVTLVFGLGFTLIPAQVLSLYGITLDVGGLFIARYLGASFLGIAALAWLVRSSPASATRKAIVQALFVLSVVGFVVALFDVFTGVGNSLVWSTVVIYLLFALGFGYFAFVAGEQA
jgi:hypothetical protein